MHNMIARQKRGARRLALGSSLCTAALVIAGCASSGTSGSGSAQAGGSGDIVFGSEVSLTGQFAPFGAGVSQGLKAAEAEVNAAGGVLGRKITLDVVDDASDPVDSVPKANLLVNHDHVVVQVWSHDGRCPTSRTPWKIQSSNRTWRS